MNPSVITFDCAQTLLELKWTPERSALICSRDLGVSLPDDGARTFAEMFYASRTAYQTANLTRNPQMLDEFWIHLHRRWLQRCNLSEALAEPFVAAASARTYGANQTWFLPFEDVRPCLVRLQGLGLRLAVISNWDLSLFRILENLDLAHYFELIVPSLAEGPEKPDPALFHIAFTRLGTNPCDVVHVGDHPEDDVAGARAAGCRSLHLDRAAHCSGNGVIRTLDELPEAFEWSV